MQTDTPPLLNIWARQLLQEHDHICRQAGMQLSRPVIEISEVTSYLGKWHSGRRTITIARSLICGQNWDTVLNVLKHEMAHQYVTEKLNGHPDHGSAFKKACAILGVSAPFRRASATISAINATAPARQLSPTDRILARIRKILALTDSSNEHEALLALQKARELMHRYNLGAEIHRTDTTESYTSLLINLKRKRVECYHSAICSLLLDYFNTEIVITTLYDAHDLTTYKFIDIMGRSSDVEIGGYIYHFLTERLPALWQQHQARHPRLKNGRNSYWLGVLRGFRQGLASGQQPGTPVNISPTKTKTNLALATSNDKAMGLFVAARYPRTRKGRKRTTRLDHERFAAGIADGLKLKFRQGVDHQGDNQRLLPS